MQSVVRMTIHLHSKNFEHTIILKGCIYQWWIYQGRIHDSL